jgi:hypothetical protein
MIRMRLCCHYPFTNVSVNVFAKFGGLVPKVALSARPMRNCGSCSARPRAPNGSA